MADFIDPWAKKTTAPATGDGKAGFVDPWADTRPEADIVDTLSRGFENTQRYLGAAGALIDDSRIPQFAIETAKWAKSQPRTPEFLKDYHESLKAAGDDVEKAEGFWDSAKAWAGLIGEGVSEPKALAFTIAESFPNFLPSALGGLVGAGAGAVTPIPGGAAVGGYAGMSAGTIATETGAKVMEMLSAEGVDLTDPAAINAKMADPDFRQRAGEAGVKKGATIAAIDLFSMKLGGKILSAPGRAWEKSATKVLTDAGIDVTDKAAVVTALGNKTLASKMMSAKAAHDAAYSGVAGIVGRGVSGLAIETVGEGAGEGFGEVASGGEFSPSEVVTEALAGGGQAVVQAGAGKVLEGGKGIVGSVVGQPAATPVTPPQDTPPADVPLPDFKPTHTLPDGTPVQQVTEGGTAVPDLYTGADGAIIEATNVLPMPLDPNQPTPELVIPEDPTTTPPPAPVDPATVLADPASEIPVATPAVVDETLYPDLMSSTGTPYKTVTSAVFALEHRANIPAAGNYEVRAVEGGYVLRHNPETAVVTPPVIPPVTPPVTPPVAEPVVSGEPPTPITPEPVEEPVELPPNEYEVEFDEFEAGYVIYDPDGMIVTDDIGDQRIFDSREEAELFLDDHTDADTGEVRLPEKPATPVTEVTPPPATPETEVTEPEPVAEPEVEEKPETPEADPDATDQGGAGDLTDFTDEEFDALLEEGDEAEPTEETEQGETPKPEGETETGEPTPEPTPEPEPEPTPEPTGEPAEEEAEAEPESDTGDGVEPVTGEVEEPAVEEPVDTGGEGEGGAGLSEDETEVVDEGTPEAEIDDTEGVVPESEEETQTTTAEPKKKPILERMAEALEQHVQDAGFTTDEELIGFTHGWQHVARGGTMSNITKRGDVQVMEGYNAAQAWLKANKLHIKKEKFEDTGDKLRRLQDWRSKTRSKTDLQQLLDMMQRSKLLTDDMVDEDAKPGVLRLFYDIRDDVIPFMEWYGRQHGGSRKSWGTPFREAVSDQWESDPDNVMDAAEKYVLMTQRLARDFAGQKNVLNVLQRMFGSYVAFKSERVNKYNANRPFIRYHLKPEGDILDEALKKTSPTHYEPIANKARIDDEDTEFDPTKIRKKQVRRRGRLDSIERSGFKDHREGKDITPTDFRKKFKMLNLKGLSDVTLGESMTAREEQDNLNYAYDALMDLAETLRMKPANVGLGGWLHFAVGALGTSTHAAHFSPAHPLQKPLTDSNGHSVSHVPVINLTRKNGDGSLAHEWFHALDFKLRENMGKDGQVVVIEEMVSQFRRRLMTDKEMHKDLERFLTGGYIYRQMGRGTAAIDHALEHVKRMDMVILTDYGSNAAALDKGKKTPYWSNNEEMFARAGESWMYDEMLRLTKIPEASWGDNYLVSDWVAAGKVRPPLHSGTPYPPIEERAMLVNMFEMMMANLVWTDSGPRVKDGYEGTKADEDALRERMTEWVRKRVAEIAAEKKAQEDDREIGLTGGSPLVKAIYRAIEDGSAPKDNRGLKSFLAAFDDVKSGDITALRMKEGQEAFESAIVMRSISILKDTARYEVEVNSPELADEYGMKRLMELYNSQPNLSAMTTTSSANQAYSTPAPLAYIVQRLAGLPNDITHLSDVYEPTAGTGQLMTLAYTYGSAANEIDPARIELLKGAYDNLTVTNNDAVENIAPRMNKRHSYVLANPPFGKLEESVDYNGYKIDKLDHLIALRSLEAMKDRGSATLILGANKEAGAITKSDRVFFNYLYSHYNVTEHFEVDGGMYSRQGASWPVRVIVIKGRAASESVSPMPNTIHRVSNYDELFARYEAIRGGLDVGATVGVRPGEKGIDGSVVPPKAETGGLPGSAGEQDTEAGGQDGAGTGAEAGGGSVTPEGAGEDAGAGGAGTDTGDAGSGLGGADTGGGAGAAGGQAGVAGTGEGVGAGAGEGVDAGADVGGDLADFSEEEFEALLEGDVTTAEEVTPPEGAKAEYVEGEGWMTPATTAAQAEQEGAKMVEGKGLMVPVDVKPKAKPTPTPEPKGVGENLAEAGEAASDAVKEGLKGLDDLFFGAAKPGGTLSMSAGMVPFTKEGYEKAKVHFTTMLVDIRKTVASVGEAFKQLIQKVRKKFGRKLDNMLKQFHRDIRSGEVKIADPQKPAAPAATEKSEEGAYQADYPGMSKSPLGGILSPTNQRDAIEQALIDVVEKHGNIDEYVRSELQYDSIEEMMGTDDVTGEIDGSRLSGAQIDGIAIAIHQMTSGGALIIGDQTGVGKGRQAAGIIRWSVLNGYIPVFVTAKKELYSDMYEELGAIGSGELVPLLTNTDATVSKELPGGDIEKLFKNPQGKMKDPNNPKKQVSKVKVLLNKIESSKKLPEGKDVIFSAYTQFQGDKAIDRMNAVRALAPNAVFILDESHEAAGSASARGAFIREVLAESKRAVYLSATYAKRGDNMAVYFLTDISKAANTMDELIDALHRGGVPLLEWVATQLTKSGQFIRREQSWDGISIPTISDDPNTEEGRATIDRHERTHDAVTERLRKIVAVDHVFQEEGMPSVTETVISGGYSITGVGNQAEASVDHSPFVAVVHNALAQLVLSIKADRVADLAIEALERGEKPVIALDMTLGAFLLDHAQLLGLKPGDPISGFDYRVVLHRALRNTRKIRVTPPEGGDSVPFLVPLNTLPVSVVEAYEEATALINSLQADLSASPIDHIRKRIMDAGYTIKEVTGRNRRVDYQDEGDPIYVNVPTEERKDRVQTVREFNDGIIDVIVANRSASTGISMHSAAKFKDKDENGLSKIRIMVIAQASLDINIYMQMLGRINRIGQEQIPLYKNYISRLPAELRPAAINSMKMKKLNANTSSKDESAVSDKDAVDFVNRYGDKVVAGFLSENREMMEELRVDIDINDPATWEGIAYKATGRLALLTVEDQRRFYTQVESEYRSYIADLTANGRNELITRTLPFEAKLLSEEIIEEGTDNDRPLLSDAKLGKYAVVIQNKSPTPEEVLNELDESLNGQTPDEFIDNMLKPMTEAAIEQETLQDAKIEEAYQKLKDEEKLLAVRSSNWSPVDITDETAVKDAGKHQISAPTSTNAETYNARIVRKDAMVRNRLNITELLKNRYKMGNKHTLKEGEDTVNGVVTNITPKWKKGEGGNPFTMSGFNINMRLTAGTGRKNVSLSQMEGVVTGRDDYNNRTGTFDWKKENIKDLFKKREGQIHARAIRYIATGNPLAAYGKLEKGGEIARFTMQDGKIEEGIVLPPSFDPETDLKKDIVIPTATQAYNLFFNEQMNFSLQDLGLRTKDEYLRITVTRDAAGMSLVLHASGVIKRGGKWFRNTDLAALIGSDFAGTRAIMEVDVPSDKVEAVLEFIYEKGEKLYGLPSQANFITKEYRTKKADEEQAGEMGAPRFSRAAAPAVEGVPVTDVEAAIAKRVAQMKGSVPVHVVQNYGGLPTEVQNKIKAEGVDVEGIAYNGTIYLVADQLASVERAQTVLFDHEMRHIGLERMFGIKLRPVLAQAWLGKEGNKIREFAAERGINTDNAAGKREATEEYIVMLAETGQENTLLQKLFAIMKDYLRRMGMNLELTDTDLREMVARAGTLAMTGAESRMLGVESMSVRASEQTVMDAIAGLQPVPLLSRSGKMPTRQLLEEISDIEGQIFGSEGRYNSQRFYNEYTKEYRPAFNREETMEARSRYNELRSKAGLSEVTEFKGTYPKDYAASLLRELKDTEFKSRPKPRLSPINTDNFEKFFGDSRVVDDDGNPLVVHHATLNESFTIFERQKSGSRGGKAGFFFSAGIAGAEEHMRSKGENYNVIPAYLSISNPLVLSSGNWLAGAAKRGERKLPQNTGQKWVEQLKSEGYDGLLIKSEGKYPIYSSDVWVAFDSNQIKSAVANTGAYDKADPDILFSRKRVRGSDEQEAAIDSTIAKGDEDITLGDRIKGFLKGVTNIDGAAIRQGLIDEYHAVTQYEKEIQGAVGDAATSASKAMRRTKNLDSVMAAVMNHGTLEYRGGNFRIKSGTTPFVDIFEKISKKGLLHLWEGWAAANRADRLIGEGKEKNFTQDQIDELLKLEHEHLGDNGENIFREALDAYQQFNKEILDMAESVGVIDAATRSVWEKNDYVPFYRAFEDALSDEAGIKGGKQKGGIQGQRSGIRKLTGGEDKIGNVLENMVMNAAHLIDASFKNVAMNRVVDLTEGIGMEEVEPGWQPVDISNAQLVSKLRKAGIIPSVKDANKLSEDSGLIIGQLTATERKEYQTLFRRMAPQGNDIVSVMTAGKIRYFRVSDALLMRAVTSMGTNNVEGLMTVMRGAKKLLTKAVTADPAFMVANFLRDTLSTFVVSDAGLTPFVDAAKGFKDALKDDPALLAIMAAGGGGGGFYHQTPSETRHQLAYQLKAMEDGNFKDSVLNSPRKLWSAWQKIGGAAENANRIAIYKKVKQAGGTEAEAIHQAQDILNFSQRGDFATMKFLIETVPFMNARIQGLDRLYRGAVENPKAFLFKGLMLTAASMALMAVNWDEDEYDELPEWDKDTYWHFFFGNKDDKGRSEYHFRMPKPFEVGAIFGTIPERAMRAIGGKDDMKIIGQRLGHMFLDTFAMNPTPQLIKPIVEQYANRTSFTDAPIVGFGLSYLQPEAQYTPWTSETMRSIAEGMPDWAPSWLRSPKRLEAGLRGYVGTLGVYALGASDSAMRAVGDYPEEAARTWGQTPVIKRFVRDQTPVATKYSARFYDMLKDANETFSTIKRYREQGRTEKAAGLATTSAGKLRVRKQLNRIAKKITAVNTQIRLVHDHKRMSADEKRRKVDTLVKRKQDLLRNSERLESNF